MKLIREVEISYFRSIYKQQLTGLKGTNILFGRNDSGKSNVLRALNLFFNNQTNPGANFNFERDFCDARRAEADDPNRDIRKFVYVKLLIQAPSSWQSSLGGEFWVKKQWSITRQDEPLIESSIRESRKEQYLTRFLNRIRFHYIPAIKDRRIFEQLLGSIYRVVASHDEFATSLAEFSNALRDRTSELTDELLNGIGINSVISPPNDLTDLFRSLDFETNSEQGDKHSLILQRGDGIQVRHIPTILAFLSDRGPRDYHIWGFEEPENSLELANAVSEARVFRAYGRARNKQIFLTSHSPAFFALDNEEVSRFFISKSKEIGNRKTSIFRKIDPSDPESPSELMGETPHLRIISDYLDRAHSEIEALRKQGDELAGLLRDRDQDILFVEGKSDVTVLTTAWDLIIGEPMPFVIESASGTTKMESLARDGRVISRLAPNRDVFVLVDNDQAGRNLYKNGKLKDGGIWHKHNSNGVWWCRLPFEESFKKFMCAIKIQKAYWPGCLENLFPPNVRETAIQAGALDLTTTPYDELLDAQRYPKIQDFLPPNRPIERLYLLSTNPDYKESFADWIAELAVDRPSILEPLQPLVHWLAAYYDKAPRT